MPDTIIDEEQQGEKKQDESVVIDGQDIESEVIDPQQIIDEPEPEKQPEPQPEPEKQPEPQPEPKPKAPLGKSRLPGLSDELKKTKRRFFSDSDLYRETVLRLDAVNAMLETVVNPGNFQKIAPLALDRYQQLLESCNAYLNSRKSRFTDTGKTRAALVSVIKLQVEWDIQGLLGGSSSLAEYPGGVELVKLVSDRGRTTKIDLDADKRKVDKVGSGSSTRHMFEENGKTVFFTKEEILQTEDEAVKTAIAAIEDPELRKVFQEIQAQEFLGGIINGSGMAFWRKIVEPGFLEKQNKDLSDDRKYKSIPDYIGRTYPQMSDISYDFTSDEKLKAFSKAVMEIFRAKNGARNFQELGSLRPGSVTSNRNVAMSRLAELLGVGSLLARSTNAEVTVGGQTVKGNLMEKAEGESLFNIAPDTLVETDLSTGEFQRQLICLQLLDSLCGQVDRNIGNYFLQAERDEAGNVIRFTGLQGIDNDMAFGDLRETDFQGKETPNYLTEQAGSLRKLVDKKGKSTLPVVDKQMAERLLAVSPEMIVYAVSDIITNKAEIKALLARLAQIKSVLGQLKKDDPDAFVDKGGWGEGTHEKLKKAEFATYYGMFVDEVGRQSGTIHGKFRNDGTKRAKKEEKKEEEEVLRTEEEPAVGSFVMTSATLFFLANRMKVSDGDKKKTQAMLSELLDVYHRANKSGDKEFANNTLLRIVDVCDNRKAEFNKKLLKVVGQLRSQCIARLAEIKGLPEGDVDYNISTAHRGLVDVGIGETIGLTGNDPFPDYPYLPDSVAKEMSGKNKYNTDKRRDILYGGKKGTHGDKYGYILTSNSMKINQGLRENNLNAGSQKTVDLLDKAAVSDALPQNARLFRLLTAGYLQFALGLESDGYTVTAKNCADINKMAGTVITDTGFMCTGYHLDTIWAQYPVLLTLLCDEGTQMFATDNHQESEIILGRGTQYMIMGAKLHGTQGGKDFSVSKYGGDQENQKVRYNGLEIFAKVMKRSGGKK
ncbi:MAG: ADP-ribosyltransferase [Oscillospiraceae bacterium]|nr:ADP-ribosyltransferase [Oscillospiraceae bacterium]